MPEYYGVIGTVGVTKVFAEDEDRALSMVRRNLFSADDSFKLYAQWAERGSRIEVCEKRTPDV
jgi:hypothetical protein